MLALLGVLQQIQQMDGCARIWEQEMRAALKAVDPDRVRGCLQALVNISHLRKVLRHHPASLVQVLIG